MRRTGAARARAAGLFAAALLLAACERDPDLPVARRIPLPAPVPAGATLAADSAGRLWIGTPGRLTALDSAGRSVAQVRVGRDSTPRLLWRAGPRLVMRDGGRLSAAADTGGTAAAGWRSASLRGAARDPRGRWVYAAARRGEVLGLDAATLRPRWGWPGTGGETLGIAASPLGDRVYVSVDATDDAPAAVHVRDAASGRVLASAEQPDGLHGLAAGPDGSLYGSADGTVVRLRHEAGGLRRAWSESPGVRGPEGALELRVDPAGERIAVFGRGRGARLAVLDAATGREIGQTTAPLDAAFSAEGRLYLLDADGVRVMR